MRADGFGSRGCRSAHIAWRLQHRDTPTMNIKSTSLRGRGCMWRQRSHALAMPGWRVELDDFADRVPEGDLKSPFEFKRFQDRFTSIHDDLPSQIINDNVAGRQASSGRPASRRRLTDSSGAPAYSTTRTGLHRDVRR